jgi:hypothetical protein
LAGNPLPPNVSNATLPGISAYNVPDETKGLPGFPEMSKPPNSPPKEGGFTGTPPPHAGGLALIQMQRRMVSGADPLFIGRSMAENKISWL